MKRTIYICIAIVYFFLNIAGLPFGLTWMAVLAPVFYVWVVLKRKKDVLLPFLTLLLPFIIAHVLFIKVNLKEYLVTMANLTAVYIFGQAFYTLLLLDTEKEKIFRLLLKINILLCGVALFCYFTPADTIFWIQQTLTANVDDFRRLKMFTYEASYYALLFAPLFLYYLLQYILGRNTIPAPWLLCMLFVPLILSFSMGVIVCLIVAGLFTFFIHFQTLHTKRRVVNGAFTAAVLILFTGIMVWVLIPDNAILLRIQNVMAGKDTSAMGRTAEAFELAQKMLQENNSYWGIGPGQLNLAGADIIRAYYLYYFTTPVAIPNAAAETLVLFGWIGFTLRIGLQICLFFVTGVWKNYYRLLLFLFMFLYQFSGSFITNIAEYVIWIMAFTPVFPEFTVLPKNKMGITPAMEGSLN